MSPSIFIFHGTEGYPEENWFPWLKNELEEHGANVFVPQFPSPPVVPAQIDEWFSVLKKLEKYITADTIFIGHSLGGVFALRVLQNLSFKIRAAFFVGTPIGIPPLLNFERDEAFSGFIFDWHNIRQKAEHFRVFHSDNDPYVGLENGKALAENLGIDLSFIPQSGHFNTASGYTTFTALREEIFTLL